MTGIDSWSTTAATNATTTGGSGNFAEGQLPSTVNNSMRQIVADGRAAFNDLAWFQYGTGDQGSGHIAVPAVYASATSFTIAGANVTTAYHPGRRVRAVGSGTGTIYGTITASSYSAPTTTVTVRWDTGTLSNETLVISLSQHPILGGPSPQFSVNVMSFGAKGDGVTDDTTAINNAISACNTATELSGSEVLSGHELYIPHGVYKITAGITLPPRVRCDGRFSGSFTLAYSGVQKGRIHGLRCYDLALRDCYFCSFDDLFPTHSLTITGTNTFGFSENVFKNILTDTMTIDCGSVSDAFVTENTFMTSRLATLTVSGVGLNQTNHFNGLDVSNGSGITNTSSGRVRITNLYMDDTSNMTGDFDVLGFYRGATFGPSVTRRNHMLFSDSFNADGDGDFFSTGGRNLFRGGEWDELNSSNWPNCIVASGAAVTTDANEPTGLGSSVAYVNATATKTIILSLDVVSNQAHRIVCAIVCKGDAPDALYSQANGDNGTNNFYDPRGRDLGNSWLLYHFTVPVPAAASSMAVLIQINGTGGSPKSFRVSTCRATCERAVTMPNFRPAPLSYTVAGLPSASAMPRSIVYVSNETGGAVLAFSDGTNWRRVTDRAVVS